MAIGNKELADAYKDLIRRLGVDFSKAKTHESSSFVEFAKRYLYKGDEITPFPISSLKNSSKRYFLLVSLLIEQSLRSFPFSVGLSEVVSDYYAVVESRPSRFRKGLETKAYITEQIMKVIRKVQSANIAFTGIIRKLNLSIPQPISNYTSLSILSGLAVESFSESDPTTSKKGGDLGALATNVVIALTSKDYPAILLENPILHAYGSVESEYLALRKLAREIDTKGKGEWDINLKSMTIPLDDRVFVETRSSQVESMASCRLASKVAYSLRSLEPYPSLFC